MNKLAFCLLASLSLSACATAKELRCTQQGKVTVHYKNADDIYYNREFNAYYIMYNTGVVFYKPEASESCSIIN